MISPKHIFAILVAVVMLTATQLRGGGSINGCQIGSGYWTAMGNSGWWSAGGNWNNPNQIGGYSIAYGFNNCAAFGVKGWSQDLNGTAEITLCDFYYMEPGWWVPYKVPCDIGSLYFSDPRRSTRGTWDIEASQDMTDPAQTLYLHQAVFPNCTF